MNENLDFDMKQMQQLLATQFTKEEFKEWLKSNSTPFRELMAFYRCALMEIETKFKVLDEELSLQYDRNPIETIKIRLKSPEGIIDKLQRKDIPVTVRNIENYVSDIAGIRIICSFPSDIYMLANAFARQDDVRILEVKDYIQKPKANGYRSLHMIVETPIFLHDSKRFMKVEVQFRTISMDWWASLEHKIRYKKDVEISETIQQELFECAEISTALDQRMDIIYKAIETNTKDTSSIENSELDNEHT